MAAPPFVVNIRKQNLRRNCFLISQVKIPLYAVSLLSDVD
ncbi:hypothetical protein PALA111701_01350 [Paenibacillus lactis]